SWPWYAKTLRIGSAAGRTKMTSSRACLGASIRTKKRVDTRWRTGTMCGPCCSKSPSKRLGTRRTAIGQLVAMSPVSSLHQSRLRIDYFVIPGTIAMSDFDLSQMVAECERFEEAWENGERPRIEDYLAVIPEEKRPGLLGHLLQIEQERRLGLGEKPSLEEYQ